MMMNKDAETEKSLKILQTGESVYEKKLKDIKTVLVVLSSNAVVFDREAIRFYLEKTYPNVAVFFWSTSGKPLGVSCPEKVDLIIDLVGKAEKFSWFLPRKLRKKARVIVGRSSWLKKSYDVLVEDPEIRPENVFLYELQIQTQVFKSVGVHFLPLGGVTKNQESEIALSLPKLKR